MVAGVPPVTVHGQDGYGTTKPGATIAPFEPTVKALAAMNQIILRLMRRDFRGALSGPKEAKLSPSVNAR